MVTAMDRTEGRTLEKVKGISVRKEGNGHREDRPERDGEDQPEDQRQAERNPRLGKRGVFLREHALEGRDTCGGHVPP